MHPSDGRKCGTCGVGVVARRDGASGDYSQAPGAGKPTPDYVIVAKPAAA